MVLKLGTSWSCYYRILEVNIRNVLRIDSSLPDWEDLFERCWLVLVLCCFSSCSFARQPSVLLTWILYFYFPLGLAVPAVPGILGKQRRTEPDFGVMDADSLAARCWTLVYSFPGSSYNIIQVPPQKSNCSETLEGAKVLCSIAPMDKLKPSYYHSFGKNVFCLKLFI